MHLRIDRIEQKPLKDYQRRQLIYYRPNNNKETPWYAGLVGWTTTSEAVPLYIKLVTKGPLAPSEDLSDELKHVIPVTDPDLIRPRENI